MKNAVIVAALAGLGIPAVGQETAPPSRARDYLLPHHNVRGIVDLDALRETDFIDEVERALLYRTLRSMLRGQYGLDLSQLDRVDATVRYREGTRDRPKVERVVLLIGDARLRLPPTDETGLEECQIEGLDARGETFRDRWTWVIPHPGLIVQADRAVLGPLLRREVRGGVPQPELMPWLSQPKSYALLAAARGDTDRDIWKEGLGLPPEAMHDADPIDGLQLRFGERKDEHFTLTATAWFERGNEGPPRLIAWLENLLEQGKASEEMALLRPWLERIKIEHEGREVTARLDLGTATQAGREFATITTGLSGLLFGNAVDSARAARR